MDLIFNITCVTLAAYGGAGVIFAGAMRTSRSILASKYSGLTASRHASTIMIYLSHQFNLAYSQISPWKWIKHQAQTEHDDIGNLKIENLIIAVKRDQENSYFYFCFAFFLKDCALLLLLLVGLLPFISPVCLSTV